VRKKNKKKEWEKVSAQKKKNKSLVGSILM
jgi:hypothetical protein